MRGAERPAKSAFAAGRETEPDGEGRTISLRPVTEENWRAAAALSVAPEQENFLDSALGILARGYAYRACRARVLAIHDGTRRAAPAPGGPGDLPSGCARLPAQFPDCGAQAAPPCPGGRSAQRLQYTLRHGGAPAT